MTRSCPKSLDRWKLVLIGTCHIDSAAAEASNLHIVALCSTGTEALFLLRSVKTDLVVLDAGVQDMAALECLHRLTSVAPCARTIVTTKTPNVLELAACLAMGASGYLVEPLDPSWLVETAGILGKGGLILAPEAHALITGFFKTLWFGEGRGSSLRSQQVLLGLVGGGSNKDIAGTLGVEVGTIKTHVHRLLQHHGVTSRQELAHKLFAASLQQLGTSSARPAHAADPSSRR